MKECHFIASTTFASSLDFQRVLKSTFGLFPLSPAQLLNSQLDLERPAERGEITSFLNSGEIIPHNKMFGLIADLLAKVDQGISIANYLNQGNITGFFNLLQSYNLEPARLWVLKLNNISELIDRQAKSTGVAQNMMNQYHRSLELVEAKEKMLKEAVPVTNLSFDHPIDWWSSENNERIRKAHQV